MIGKDQKFSFERKMLLGVCSLAIIRPLFSVFQLFTGDVGMFNLIGQTLLFLVYFSTLVMVYFYGYKDLAGIAFGLCFTFFNAALWIHNGGLGGVVEESMTAALIVVAVVNRGRWVLRVIAVVLICQVVLLLLWEFNNEWVAPLVSAEGNQVIKYQVMLVLVTCGVIYFTFLYDLERKRQWAVKDELHKAVAEIRKENERLKEQELEIQELNEMLERMVEERKAELARQTKSIERYIDLSSSQISPNLLEMTDFINKSGFEGNYGSLLKKSGFNLIESFKKIHKKRADGRSK